MCIYIGIENDLHMNTGKIKVHSIVSSMNMKNNILASSEQLFIISQLQTGEIIFLHDHI